jgi:polyhydroxyalkanoate synthesis regulator protein
MEAFQRNQSQFRDAMTGAFANPFAEMAKRNMEMFAAATSAKPEKTPAPEPDTKAELAELKEQMAALQRKLDKLGG